MAENPAFHVTAGTVASTDSEHIGNNLFDLGTFRSLTDGNT